MPTARLTAHASLLLAASAFAQPASPPPFHAEGPITAFMVDGAAVGASSGGLTAAIHIADAGKAITGATAPLHAPGWEGDLQLSIEGATYADGVFKGTLKLTNSTKCPLEGLRIDLRGTTQTHKTRDSAGKLITAGDGSPVTATIAATGDMGPALFASDLAPGESTDPLPLVVKNLPWGADTTGLDVIIAVSGLAALDPVRRDEFNAGALTFDPKDRLLMGAIDAGDILRFDPASGRTELAMKVASPVAGLACDPRDGSVYAYPAWGNGEIAHLSGAGDELDPIPPDASPDNPPQRMLRCTPDGALWTAYEGAVRFVDGKPAGAWRELSGGAVMSAIGGFAVDPKGVMWVTYDNSLFRLDTTTKAARRVTSGPDPRLGRLMAPQGVALDASGQVYVAEHALPDQWARVSVFDASGKFVRAFGRGGRATPAEFEMHAGQVEQPHDVAIAKNGRVYVSVAARKFPEDEPAAHVVMVYQPF